MKKRKTIKAIEIGGGELGPRNARKGEIMTVDWPDRVEVFTYDGKQWAKTKTTYRVIHQPKSLPRKCTHPERIERKQYPSGFRVESICLYCNDKELVPMTKPITVVTGPAWRPSDRSDK